MNARLVAGAVLGLAVLAGTGRCVAPAPEEPKVVKPTAEEIAKAEKQVQAALQAVNGAYARVTPIADEPVLRAFPKHLFFSVLYPQYPVGRQPPPGHSASNIYAVARDKEAKPELAPNPSRLEALFKSALGPAQDEGRAKDAARAWLLLASVLHNDGFYKFTLIDEATTVARDKGGLKASARLVASAGGNGEVNGTLELDDAGKLTRGVVLSTLKPGIRPICQATKLLDADPIVRRMAEENLRIMGRAAGPYLDEQRAKASPELRQAIDRIWQRIVEDDR